MNHGGLSAGYVRGGVHLEIQVCLTALCLNLAGSHLNMAANVFLFHRFTVDELIELVAVLHIPNPLTTSNRYLALGLEALSLTCAHLRSPNNQWALATRYHCPQSAISQITHEVVSNINKSWGHLQFNFEGILSPQAMTQYAAAIHVHGTPTRTVVGFLNCTICPAFHLTISESLVYMGYKKCHGMKFQAVTVLNRMIVHLDGLYCAPQNNASVLMQSGLLKLMREHAIQPGSVEGDPPK